MYLFARQESCWCGKLLAVAAGADHNDDYMTMTTAATASTAAADREEDRAIRSIMP